MIDERFEAVAREHAVDVAVAMGSTLVTYAELSERVAEVSETLTRAGARPGHAVAIRLAASVEYVIAVLATLTVGAAYLPLNPKDPARREREILQRARPSHVVTADGVVALDEAQPLVACDVAPTERPAYVMFTSGSTGRPNGVVVPHRGVFRLVVDPTWINLTGDVRTILASPLAFDASTLELWAPLLNGGCVVIPQPGSLSLASLAAEIRRHDIQQLWLPAGIFVLMVDHHLAALAGVTDVMAGGDVLSPRHVERASAFLERGCVSNGYGPTENTTFSTTYRVARGERFAGAVPIGRPIDGTFVRVLDDDLHPVAPGSLGQLAVGGSGLALGYLDDPALTAARFVADPGDPSTGALVYLTGDLVRERDDGNLDFLGRRDGQVKVRGHRVECTEVESALLRNPRVRQALVVPQPGVNGASLKAYVVPEADALDSAAVRRTLAADVPDYMVPTEIDVVSGFPLTVNGKIDRARFDATSTTPSAATRQLVAPADELERRMVNVFRRVLGRQGIGATDGFFDLGGDSLAALELIETVQLLFGTPLDSGQLLAADTPRGVTALVRAGDRPPDTTLVPIQPDGERPPFFCVHGGGGEVLFLAEMRRHLSRHQPFYALSPPGANAEAAVPRSVEAFAEVYADAIRRFRPSGPYVLGGLCFGGNIAVETGRRLLAAGGDVPVVVLFDTVFPSKLRVADAITREVGGQWLRARRRAAGGRPPLWSAPVGAVEWAILTAVAAYRPRPYPGRIAAFVGDTTYFPSWARDPRLRWARVAQGGFAVRHVRGARSKMFGREHAPLLARRLEDYLDNVVAVTPG